MYRNWSHCWLLLPEKRPLTLQYSERLTCSCIAKNMAALWCTFMMQRYFCFGGEAEEFLVKREPKVHCVHWSSQRRGDLLSAWSNYSKWTKKTTKMLYQHRLFFLYYPDLRIKTSSVLWKAKSVLEVLQME